MVGEELSSFFLSSSPSSSPVRIKIPFELEQAEEKKGEGQGGSYLTGRREGGYSFLGVVVSVGGSPPLGPSPQLLSRAVTLLQLIITLFSWVIGTGDHFRQGPM